MVQEDNYRRGDGPEIGRDDDDDDGGGGEDDNT